jgi:transcriptional regulator with XRE-family HTH domain
MNGNSGKILKTQFSKGYERVNLTHKGKSKQYFIHRLVAMAFIPNPEHKPEVNHINGDKSCNYDYNLEWVTHSENEIHAFKTGLNKGPNSKNIKFRNITDKQVRKICKLLEENELSEKQIADKVGCSRNTVISVLKGKSHTKISKDYNLNKYVVKTDFSKSGDENNSTKYSDDDIRHVCELIATGKYNLREVEAMTGIHYQTIRNVYYGTCRRDISKYYNFGEIGVNPLYKQREDLAKKICELLGKGYNTKEVANKLKISRSIARGILSGSTWTTISKNYNFMKNKQKRK